MKGVYVSGVSMTRFRKHPDKGAVQTALNPPTLSSPATSRNIPPDHGCMSVWFTASFASADTDMGDRRPRTPVLFIHLPGTQP